MTPAFRHALVVLTTLLLGLLWWSWGKWLDPLIDFGRELYLPWQITEGRVLYRDLASFNGPLSPYVNAVWFGIGGTSLRTLGIANACLAIVLSWLLFALLRRFASPLAALVAAAMFVLLFSVSHPLPVGNYNFITPYSHELTHGIILTVVALTFLARFVVDDQTWALPATGLVAGLILLTKIEVAIAAWLALAATMVARHRLRSTDARRIAIEWTTLAGGAVASLGIATLLLAVSRPLPEAIDAILMQWRLAFRPGVAAELASLPFYQLIAGTRNWVASAGSLMLWTAAYVALFVVIIALSRVKRQGKPVVPPEAFAIIAAIASVAFGLFVDDRPARPLPILTGALMLLFAHGIVARKRGGMGAALHLGWIVFAAALLARMALNPRLSHYGFALAMPATLSAVVFLLDWLPRRVQTAETASAIRAATAGVLLVVCTANLVATSREFQRKQVRVGHGGDAFFADDRGHIINAALQALAAEAASNRSLVVLPEGVMINYLARLPSPVRFMNFMPPELIIFGEAQMVRELDAAPPRVVALVHKDTSEYGARFFGRDYGASILRWVEDRYRRVQLIGAEPMRDQRFGIVLLERK
jgi:hypothetical protein